MYEFIQKFPFWLGLFSTFITDCCSSYFYSEYLKKNLRLQKIALFYEIIHVFQLLVGIILYFVSPNGFNMIKAVEWVVNNRKSFASS
jgi:hypothetical protein